MDPERFKRIEEIYHAALEVDSKELASFLDRECGSDLELGNEVKTMLQVERSPQSLLDTPPDDIAAGLFSERRDSNKFLDKKVGRYEIERILGEGGMGTVFLARDSRLARPVALKILPVEMVANDDRVQRFMHEARAASALNHPHILTVYEIDEATAENGEVIHFISTEFVDGKTLDALIHDDRAQPADLLRYLSQVASGLAKAHSAGIIHRDLKPDNIMVTRDGYAKILDFGLAKLTDTETALGELQKHRSRPGVILGTLGYMSPEQAQGRAEVDERSDIFSFGCILYEAITGRKAFEAETTIDSLHKIIHGHPAPISAFGASVPDKLAAIVDKCLAKDPNERFRDAGEIAELLNGIPAELLGRVPQRSERYGSRNSARASATRPSRSRSTSGSRRQVTVMLIDASAISERYEDPDPEITSSIMTGLRELVYDVTAAGGGKIGERLADTFLAVWGTEAIRENDPEMAVRTALELKARANDFIDGRSIEMPGHDDRRDCLLKISISTGTVLIGNTRDTGEFMTTGTAVNAVKRLVADARPGDILVSHDTYRHIRGLFQMRRIDPNGAGDVSGRMRRTNIYSVIAVKPRVFRTEAHGVEDTEAQMVGRDAEIAKLLDALESVKETGRLQVFTIVGEAGLGKSRVLFEFYDQVDLLPDKFVVFKGRAIEAMREPYSLVRDVFRFRFDISENDTAEIAREKFINGMLSMTDDFGGTFARDGDPVMKIHLIGHLIGFDLSGSPYLSSVAEGERHIHDRAVLFASQFFSAVSQVHPAVFYLDDLHWADDESLAFLDEISERCGDSPVLITCFTRPVLFERRPNWGEGREDWSRLVLAPLTRRETRKLIGSILQKVRDIPARLIEILISKTGGNPYFVQELIKMFVEQGVIATGDREWTIDEARIGEISVPPTLNGVLQSRLDRLTEMEMRALQRASVVGREFWDNAIADLDDDIDLASTLASLRRKELLFRKENAAFENVAEYVFRHSLLRDACYQTIVLDERRYWHLLTAEWFVGVRGERRNEYSAVIADHFEKAGEIENAALWYGAAGKEARRSFASKTAEENLRRALELWNKLSAHGPVTRISTEQVMKWKHGLGAVLFDQAKFQEAIDELTSMLRMAVDLDNKLSQAFAYWGLSFSHFEVGDTRSSLECSIETVRIADDPEIASLAKARSLKLSGLYRQGRALVALGRFEEAIDRTEEALRHFADAQIIDRVVQGDCLHLLAATNMYLGRLDQAREYEDKEIEVAKQIGDQRRFGNALNSLGFQQYMRGQPLEAIGYFDQAIEIAIACGNKGGEIMARSNRCGAQVVLGDYAAAESVLNELIVEIGDDGHFLATEMYRFLAEALIGQKRSESALDAARRSLELSQASENEEAIGEAWRVLGITASSLNTDLLLNGETVSAADCFQRSLEIFESLKMEASFALTLYNYAQYEAARGDGDPGTSNEMSDRSSAISKRLGIDTHLRSPYFNPVS